MSGSALVRTLTAAAERAAHQPAPPSCAGCGKDADVLADRPDGAVVRHGGAVAKAHAPDTDPVALAARVAVAAHPALAGILLPPLTPPVTGPLRPVTTWPYGSPVDPADPGAAPWEEAAVLLARLHTVELAALPGPLPPMRGPAKVARAVARMRAALPASAPRPAAVLAAWRNLPARARGESPALLRSGARLCHGDLHLGQLVRHPAPDGPWLLIDIDDLGAGDPAWDLARPAAWYAAGLLPPDAWTRFLAAYRAAGGPAVSADGDPWPELDVPARALTVQTAALALAKSAEGNRPLDGAERIMLDSCSRIAALPPELTCGTAS